MELQEFNKTDVENNFFVAEDIYNQLSQQKFLPSGDYVPFEPEDLIILCQLAIYYLKQDSMLLNLKAPIRVIGDVHGQYNYLWKFLKWNRITGQEMPQYLFLGDYVDRGENSIETISLVLSLKILNPDKVFLIRGNHETPEMTASYGFLNECTTRFSDDSVYQAFLRVFEYLPLAAVITNQEGSKSIFCVHGGISPDLKDIHQLENFERPFVLSETFPFHILWSDPCPTIEGFEINADRAGAYKYGKNALATFMQDNKIDQIFRAHEVAFEGYCYPFQDKTVITIFSAPNYCGELQNKGAMLELNDDLTYSFHVENPCFFSI